MILSKRYKKFILTLSAVILIAGFFFIPPHKVWMSERLVPYWKDFLHQRKRLAVEQRKQERFGFFYTCCKQIAAPFASRPDKKNICVLMPPTAYFKKRGIDYEVCEPGVFYYFTGIRTVQVTSNNALKANWYVRVENKKIIVDSVINIKSLSDTIAALKKITIPS